MNLDNCPNIATYEASYKCERHLYQAKKVMCSLSGGADSDIMLDFIQRILKEKAFDYDCEIHYVFFDTGIEFKATKEHLDELEKKYNITIERVKAKVPVPLGCKKYGLPFISKFISEQIDRLQQHNFDFVNDGNKSFEELNAKYKGLKAALMWWCNKKQSKRFNIEANPLLKEFMIADPPDFRISSKCCNGAKKNTSHDYEKEQQCDLKCLGLRKAEGGIRSSSIKSCFDEKECGKAAIYRPIWWFTDKDKEEYRKFFNVQYSKCYTEYGLKRTGCAGCPFGSRFEQELEIVKKHEPLLYQAINNIFGKSYEYMRKYKIFKRRSGKKSLI